MVELVVRLVFSLAVVLGMVILLARFGGRRFRGSADALVRVVHRQALSRSASVAVVSVGSRVLVLGTTEHQVQLLTELEPEELEHLDPVAQVEQVEQVGQPEQVGQVEQLAAAPAVRAARSSDGALAGSVLSAQTWRQALAAATGRDREAS
jgi:flagellar protein FliO/FliZ